MSRECCRELPSHHHSASVRNDNRHRRDTPRERSTRKPIASSATDATNPGPARVTSTPAGSSFPHRILRISTAQRTKARIWEAVEKLRGLGQAIGHDDMTSRAASIRRPCRAVVGLMQGHLGQRLQAVQAAPAVILAPRLGVWVSKTFKQVSASFCLSIILSENRFTFPDYAPSIAEGARSAVLMRARRRSPTGTAAAIRDNPGSALTVCSIGTLPIRQAP